MFEYLITFFAMIFFYMRFKVVWRRRKYKNVKFPVMKGAESYFVKGKDKKVAFLLLHGLSSTPDDFRFLKEYFEKKKIAMYAPLFRGHGTSVFDLANTGWRDWYSDCEHTYSKLKRLGYENIYVVGNSMGGNLAFMLAKDHPEIKGIISLGTPIYFKSHNIVESLHPIYNFFVDFYRKSYPKDMLPLVSGKIHYKYFPVNKMGDMLRIMAMTRIYLRKLRMPILIVQSSGDNYVSVASAKYIYKKSKKSRMKKLFWVDDSYHVVILDKHREKVFKEIESFIKYNES